MVGIRALRKAQRPGEILEAAFDEFVINGYAATRLEDVAKRVGVTKGTIYFYFGSKEAVFEAAIQTVGSLPLAALNQNWPAFTDDIVEDLRVFLDNLYRFIDDTPRARETLRLLVAEAQRFPQAVDTYFTAFMDPVIERVRARLALAAARGEIRCDLPNGAEAIASPPFAYMVMSLLFKDRRGVDSRQLFRSQFDLLFGGLLPPEGPAAPEVADRASAWTAWRPAPGPRNSDMLVAPIGAGLYELRLASGELLLIGSTPGVASSLATLFATGTAHERDSHPRQHVLTDHPGGVEFRTRSCASLLEAQQGRRTLRPAGLPARCRPRRVGTPRASRQDNPRVTFA